VRELGDIGAFRERISPMKEREKDAGPVDRGRFLPDGRMVAV